MTYEALRTLRFTKDSITERENVILSELAEKLKDVFRSLGSEAASIVYSYENVTPDKSVKVGVGGRQLTFLIRTKQHTPDTKRFSVIKLSFLDAAPTCFIKVDFQPRGNETVGSAYFQTRLKEYFQGLLGTPDTEVLG